MTYCYDLLVRHLHFSPLSLIGAVIVFVSFVFLNILELHESRADKAGIVQRTEHLARSESNGMLEASLLDIQVGGRGSSRIQ
jgi:hypothetical protein